MIWIVRYEYQEFHEPFPGIRIVITRGVFP